MTETPETLHARLSALEDRHAIADLIAGYGPAVDALDGDAAAAIWAADGTYRIGADLVLRGHADIAGIRQMSQHRGYVAQGCAHVLSPHKIVLDGERASAHGYSLVLLHDAATGQWRVERASANRWEFRKTAQGWQAVTRTADLLTGSDAARALLAWSAPQGDTP